MRNLSVCSVSLFAFLFFVFSPMADTFGASSVTLKCVTFLPKGDPHLTYFWKFIDRIQQQSKGELTIRVVGGPEAIPSFEQIQATRTGVVDLVASCGAYYVGDLKEALAFQYGNIPPLEERKIGFYDFMDQIHQQKLNLKYLGRFSYPGRFYFFSNKRIDKIADFKGKRVRTNPGYEPFLLALGSSPMNTTFSEIYSVMERGVVDAFAWPIPGPLSYGWEAIFKYVVLPGFYEMNTVTLMNLSSWNKLPDSLKKIVNENILWMEKEIVPYYEEVEKGELKTMADKKKELVMIDDPKAYLKIAMDAAWKLVNEKCPETGPKMEKMIRK